MISHLATVTIPAQTIAVWAIVALTLALFARNLWKMGKKRHPSGSGQTGCGGSCGCPSSALKKAKPN